jgi:maleamate amidohydrolase
MTGNSVDYNDAVRDAEDFRRDLRKRGTGSTPAVLVVDFQRAFTEHALCGPDTAEAMRQTSALLAVARASGVPVIYLGVVYDTIEDVPLGWRGSGNTIFARCTRGAPTAQINPLVAMADGDVFLSKTHASAFFGTDLDGILRGLGVDTLLLTGTSTSGCIRATAVDADARSYRVMVVEECCDEFRALSKPAALYDLADRYADVVPVTEMIDYLAGVGAS